MQEEITSVHDFIEHTGLYFDKSGLPGTSGRILGHLLTCDPPAQSSSELARALETTSGSISTNTRLLVSAGMIERVPVRGRRGMFFQVAPGAFSSVMGKQVDQIREFRQILDEGLASMADSSDEQRARLQDAWELYAFLEEEFPKLMERFEARKRRS